MSGQISGLSTYDDAQQAARGGGHAARAQSQRSARSHQLLEHVERLVAHAHLAGEHRDDGRHERCRVIEQLGGDVRWRFRGDETVDDLSGDALRRQVRRREQTQQAVADARDVLRVATPELD